MYVAYLHLSEDLINAFLMEIYLSSIYVNYSFKGGGGRVWMTDELQKMMFDTFLCRNFSKFSPWLRLRTISIFPHVVSSLFNKISNRR